jgi:hypothetical protein
MDAPLNFIKEPDTHKHILLLYTDPEYAKRIEFQFIENGLAKGEHCTYATQEDPDFIRGRMEKFGIDAGKFIKKGLLHICQPSDPFIHPEGILEGAKKCLEIILKDSKPPFRIVTTIIPDTEITTIIDVHIKIEKEFHANFENFQGSMICPYNVQNLEQHKERNRIQELIDSHHSVIYA